MNDINLHSARQENQATRSGLELLENMARTKYMPDMNWEEVTKWKTSLPREFGLLVKAYITYSSDITSKPNIGYG